MKTTLLAVSVALLLGACSKEAPQATPKATAPVAAPAAAPAFPSVYERAELAPQIKAVEESAAALALLAPKNPDDREALRKPITPEEYEVFKKHEAALKALTSQVDQPARGSARREILHKSLSPEEFRAYRMAVNRIRRDESRLHTLQRRQERGELEPATQGHSPSQSAAQ